MQIVTAPIIVPISRRFIWEACALADGSLSVPDVGFVEPMLRRRLSSLARMTLRVAYDCAQDRPNLRLVYASRHGELARTTAMLEALARQQELSPTVFSMSVLNAGAGLFSILQKNVAPSTAISAGRSSFGYGLLEAALQLAEKPAEPVLFVYADEPATAVYGEVDPPGVAAHALALLLESGAALRIACSTVASEGAESLEAQSRAFLRGLDAGSANWCGDEKTWQWTRL